MDKQEIKELDCKKQEKIDNKYPINSTESHPTTQEHHHARHALYFLYFGTYSVVNNKNAWCTSEKAERIRIHLSCLKEFISEYSALENAVNVLLLGLNQTRLSTHSEWGLFLLRNWEWILQLAAHYGEDKKCFPESYFQVLKRIVEANEQV